MFDFGNANDGQRKAIAAADGPVLITAGPGTGKTYTLVQRAIYLIEECNVKAGEHLHCHIYGKGCEGTGNTYYKRACKSKHHGKHQRNVYRYVPLALPSYAERAFGIYTASPKLPLDGFV